ncbi:MAG: class I SAM-dependent RNA methyltransferase [Pseudomonadales bacterium]|nr:class I SAM-dependent RNA methyltransferase [Pseudomonadales bacterium]MCP5185101.1 class I SAM-dependent RNA methyltransferase [Pseudomonadales bacterium]
MKATITIDSLAFGGDGVGRLQGMAVFVPGACPGDRLEVRITEKNRRFARARIETILTPGDARIDPSCPHAATCGGCQWQQVDYASQFAAKCAVVERALARYTPATVARFPAPATEGYRRRARLHWTGGRQGTLGFHAARSRRIVDLIACPQLEPALQPVVPLLHERLTGIAGARGEVELLAGYGAQVHIAVTAQHGASDQVFDVLAEPMERNCAGLRVSDGHTLRQQGAPDIALDARGLRAHAAVFTQANALQDAALRSAVQRAFATCDGGSLLEFHAGIGNFSLDLAERFNLVRAVESAPEAVQLLRGNTAGRGVEVVPEDANRFEWRQSTDAILLDPPREGAAPLMPRIAASRSPAVVYVSCDPMTLARDLAPLHAAGYRLDSVDIIDMMPHTYHVEVVCRLTYS